jgi:hypothetical protein
MYTYLKHDPDAMNELMQAIVDKVRWLATGQFWGVLYLRYWPHACEKLVADLIKFCEKATHKYVELPETNIEQPSFEQWQMHVAQCKELDFQLNKLFWGDYNENREVVNPELWNLLNRCAITLIEITGLLKSEYHVK